MKKMRNGQESKVEKLTLEALESRVAPLSFFSEAQVEDPSTRSWTYQAIGRVTHPAASIM